MPRGSTGAVVAPTYPMLRDATLATFLDMVQRAKILRRFNKSDMEAELAGDRKILFRSADKPERLRGPNLGWFMLDEAAMQAELTWQIMIGRLREAPGRAWGATTPRGKNWVYRKFVVDDPRYKIVKAPTQSNTFLPDDFVETLLDSYDYDFARQEVGGEFLDEAFGQLLPDWWVDRLPSLVRPNKSGGQRWMGVDLGEGSGGDPSVILVGDAWGILHGEESPWVGPGQAAARMSTLGSDWGVRPSRMAYDAGGGRGLDIEPYLEQHGLSDAMPYRGTKEIGSITFENKRSKMGWHVKQRLDPDHPKPPPMLQFDPAELERRRQSAWYVEPEAAPFGKQDPFCLPENRPWWPRLQEELKALFWFHKGKRIALEKKEDMAKRIKRSPNMVDALFIGQSVTLIDEAA